MTDNSLASVARLALKLGLTAFGGPAAHIAMLRTEVVDRLQWISADEFLDLLGAANLVPGPSSTEMVMLVGERRAGLRGLVTAGACFILPAALMVLAFAWAYVRYGSTPGARWLLYGVKPVIIAIVAQALWGLGRTAVKGPLLGVLGIAVLSLSLMGVNVIVLLLGAGALYATITNGRGMWDERRTAPALVLPSAGALTTTTVAHVSLLTLFLTFLKIGAVLYGSGYVLLAFLQSDFVDHLHWLTERQLLDAVAVGQFTPGPVFTTATFVGYVVAGWWGALLATVGIFLPSFLYIGIVRSLVPRLRSSSWMGAALDGVNVAAVGLMAAVTLELARAAIVDAMTAGLALVALCVLIRWRVNSVWLVMAGGIVGIGYRLLFP